MKAKVCMLLFALLTAGNLWSYDFKVDGLCYNFIEGSNNEVEVTYEQDPSIFSTAYYSLSGEIFIPSSVVSNGINYNVTSIGDYAFWSCALTSINIPESVTSIGDYAIQLCMELKQINVDAANTVYCSENGILFNKNKTTLIQYPAKKNETTYSIPESVTNIGDAAFFSCLALTSINIPENIRNIGTSAFAYCIALTSINIPKSITSIGEGAFLGSSALTSINVATENTNYSSNNGVLFNADKTILIKYPEGKTETMYAIPESVINIGNDAFYYCFTLTSITIPNSVTSIGDYAFHYCSSLTSVNIPENIISIGDYAFSNCLSLTSITIPENVTSIGTFTFKSCSSLTSINVAIGNTNYSSDNGVLFNADKTILIKYPEGKTETLYTIPESVTSIGEYAFQSCSALTSVNIPENVTSIGEYAFQSCSALTSVNIPENITNIGTHTFSYCSSITSVTIPGSVTNIGEQAFYKCTSITAITIPEGVKEIAIAAFGECNNLTDLQLPSSLCSIGEYCFFLCSNLQQMRVNSITPPTIKTSTFFGVRRSIPVYVPAGSLEAYQEDIYWNEFLLQAYSNPETGIIRPESETITFYVAQGILHNPQAQTISLYNMQGQMVYQGHDTEISMPIHGIYIVKTQLGTQKVVF